MHYLFIFCTALLHISILIEFNWVDSCNVCMSQSANDQQPFVHPSLLVRISESLAKMELSNFVHRRHAEEAWRLFQVQNTIVFPDLFISILKPSLKSEAKLNGRFQSLIFARFGGSVEFPESLHGLNLLGTIP